MNSSGTTCTDNKQLICYLRIGYLRYSLQGTLFTVLQLSGDSRDDLRPGQRQVVSISPNQHAEMHNAVDAKREADGFRLKSEEKRGSC